MANEKDKEVLKEFSSEFLAQGIAGLFATGDYESVKIEITFVKRKPEEKISGDVKPVIDIKGSGK